jgi:hypothetical protein
MIINNNQRRVLTHLAIGVCKGCFVVGCRLDDLSVHDFENGVSSSSVAGVGQRKSR